MTRINSVRNPSYTTYRHVFDHYDLHFTVIVIITVITLEFTLRDSLLLDFERRTSALLQSEKFLLQDFATIIITATIIIVTVITIITVIIIIISTISTVAVLMIIDMGE